LFAFVVAGAVSWAFLPEKLCDLAAVDFVPERRRTR